MQQSYDGAYFAAVVCLPLLVRVLMVPRFAEPLRAWATEVGERLWAHLLEREEPDELVLRRWAQTKRDLLERHLARVRNLVVTDDAMSATRQLANRLAYARLQVDVAAAVAAAPERDLDPEPVVWQPTTGPVRYLPTPRLVQASGVEVMEFGPSGRWF